MKGRSPGGGNRSLWGVRAGLEAGGASVLQQLLVCSLLMSLVQIFLIPRWLWRRIPKCSDSLLFSSCQQEVAEPGIGLVQGQVPAGDGATPAFPGSAALAAGRLGNCEHFSGGQRDSRVLRSLGWWWISSFSSQTSPVTISCWSVDGASTHSRNLWCPSLIPHPSSNPVSATINSLLFPRNPPLPQAHQDVSTGSGCTCMGPAPLSAAGT